MSARSINSLALLLILLASRGTVACNNEQSSQQNVDAGDAQPDAGDALPDAGDAGDATPCTGHNICTDPEAPVCLSQTCQPCDDPSQCFAKDPSRPECVGGQCVECIVSETDCLNSTEPICNAGLCEACNVGSNDCVAPYPTAPICIASGCVQCATSTDCSDPNPICDPATNTCRPCEAHADCDFLDGTGNGVCDWDIDTCVPTADIIYVDINGTCNTTGPGTLTAPLCQINQVWQTLSASRNTVLVASGAYQPIIVNSSDSPRIVTRDGAEITFTNSQSIIEVSGATTELLVEGFAIHAASGAGNYGVECFNSASVTLLSNEIHNNTDGGINASGCTVNLGSNIVHTNSGGGINASSCTLNLDSNTVHTNSGGGIWVANSDYTITNNIIYGNGAGQASYGGVYLSGISTTQVFAHNTVVTNFTSGGNDAAVRCIDAVDLINSILYNNVNEGAGGNSCTYVGSWIWSDADPGFECDDAQAQRNLFVHRLQSRLCGRDDRYRR